MTTDTPQESVEFAFGTQAQEEVITEITADEMNSLGGEHYLRADFAKAEECFLAVLQADPHHAAAWSNLGLVRQKAGLPEDAFKCYVNSLDEAPDKPGTLSNLGWLYEGMGKDEHAIRCLERAIAIDPTHPDARVNLGYCYLKQFRFAEGWPLLQARFETTPPASIARDYGDIKPWDGGKCERLLIWQEQGVGDQVLYSTLIPELIFSNQDFTFEVEARLIPALQRSFPAVKFTADVATSIDGCDAHVPMMGLATHFRKTLDSFSAQPHRLLVSDPKCNGTDPKKTRIAFSWRSFQGRFNFAKERQKSAQLSDFDLLGQRDDVQLVSVQYGDVRRELESWDGNPIFTPELDLFNDIDGVLGMIAACDAVVTTSNVTAHFAGALGKRTFLLIKGDVAPFFYWQAHRGRSLWYPSVRIVTGPTWKEAVEAAVQQTVGGTPDRIRTCDPRGH